MFGLVPAPRPLGDSTRASPQQALPRDIAQCGAAAAQIEEGTQTLQSACLPFISSCKILLGGGVNPRQTTCSSSIPCDTELVESCWSPSACELFPPHPPRHTQLHLSHIPLDMNLAATRSPTWSATSIALKSNAQAVTDSWQIIPWTRSESVLYCIILYAAVVCTSVNHIADLDKES